MRSARALANVEHHPETEGLWIQFLVRAHTWVAGLMLGPGVNNLQSGPEWEALSPFLSL